MLLPVLAGLGALSLMSNPRRRRRRRRVKARRNPRWTLPKKPLGPLPRFMQDATAAQRERVLDFFASMPLKELRRRQSINAQQAQLAFKKRDDRVLEHLQVNERLLTEAVDRVAFGPKKRRSNPSARGSWYAVVTATNALTKSFEQSLAFWLKRTGAIADRERRGMFYVKGKDNADELVVRIKMYGLDSRKTGGWDLHLYVTAHPVKASLVKRNGVRSNPLDADTIRRVHTRYYVLTNDIYHSQVKDADLAAYIAKAADRWANAHRASDRRVAPYLRELVAELTKTNPRRAKRRRK